MKFQSIVLGAAFTVLGCHSSNSPSVLSASSASGITPASGPALAYPGVNLDGGEYSGGKVDAKVFFDYVYPSNAELDYYASKDMKIVRVPFELNRLQKTRGGQLETTELAALDAVVQHAQSAGLAVLLDPHDFGYMTDNSGTSRLLGVDPLMPGSNLADFWAKMATHFKSQSGVFFGLMNEPHDQSAVQWKDVAVTTVNAIRATGATNKILIPGTSWTGAQSWVSSGNAAAWEGFSDSNFAFEVHEYLDSDNSGTHSTCLSGKGAQALSAFATWAKAHGVKGFLGEMGWANNAACMAEGQAVMDSMTAMPDVWLGYSYWAGGAWLGTYMYSVEPQGLGTSNVVDQPQMAVLSSHL